MKEEEAKTKWCPQTRLVLDNPQVAYIGNRFLDNNENNCMCRASDCMMWVWNTDENKIHSKTDGFDPNDYQGHCGLVK